MQVSLLDLWVLLLFKAILVHKTLNYPAKGLHLLFFSFFLGSFDWKGETTYIYIYIYIYVYKGTCSNLSIPMAVLATAPGKSGGLLGKPVIRKATPGRESEFDLGYAEVSVVAVKIKLDNWAKFYFTASLY